ncbi:hypothetical protein [Pseudarthrobacter sp. PS3-L1]|uniref:hypothetical protein n=1 Tax=Pseudarthrobacter sp. PS3-L1 TaxID=3046207 RepID=UPI0024BAB2AC|nr:hypothetical protein [Pseudarthrobacter sp. PS3-L1]MDJ0321848.1 hypothetical protein [Pseudarthrobacter sp. PS3-L1]
MKASELCWGHIGERVTLKTPRTEISDRLIGIKSETDVVEERALIEAVPRRVMGRSSLSLAFLHAGEIRVHPDDEVTIHD